MAKARWIVGIVAATLAHSRPAFPSDGPRGPLHAESFSVPFASHGRLSRAGDCVIVATLLLNSSKSQHQRCIRGLGIDRAHTALI